MNSVITTIACLKEYTNYGLESPIEARRTGNQQDDK